MVKGVMWSVGTCATHGHQSSTENNSSAVGANNINNNQRSNRSRTSQGRKGGCRNVGRVTLTVKGNLKQFTKGMTAFNKKVYPILFRSLYNSNSKKKKGEQKQIATGQAM